MLKPDPNNFMSVATCISLSSRVTVAGGDRARNIGGDSVATVSWSRRIAAVSWQHLIADLVTKTRNRWSFGSRDDLGDNSSQN